MSRVLLVGKGPPDRGGIPAFVDLLLTSELTTRHSVEFLNLSGKERARGGEVSTSNVSRTVRDIVDVWRRSRDADVVHVHSAMAPGVTLGRAGALALAARLRGARPVVHAHGGRVQLWLDRPARRTFARVALAPAAAVVAVSEGAERALRDAGVRGVRRVENAIDERRFTPAASTVDPPVVLTVATLTPRKGLLDLFEASDAVAARGIEHRVVVVGGLSDDGAEAEREVRDAAATHARQGRIVLAGERSPADMPSAYAGATMFCLASWWEAMPLSILEAMAAGLPVVATAVGDVARVVADGETGLVVPARDPGALASALARVLSDPARARRMGEAGRARLLERWSLARLVRDLDAIYEGD